MTNRTKQIAWLVFFLGAFGILLGGIIFTIVPSQTKHIGYLLYPKCWNCTETSWELGAGHSIIFEHPNDWDVDGLNYLIITEQSLYQNGLLLIEVTPVDWDIGEESEFVLLLDRYVNTTFADFQSFEIIEPVQGTVFNGYDGAKARVRAIPYTKTEVLDSTNKLAFMLDHEVILLEYDGRMFLITSRWDNALPEIDPWGYDQMQMILNSMKFD